MAELVVRVQASDQSEYEDIIGWAERRLADDQVITSYSELGSLVVELSLDERAGPEPDWANE